jgi:hypothetical protein
MPQMRTLIRLCQVNFTYAFNGEGRKRLLEGAAFYQLKPVV